MNDDIEALADTLFAGDKSHIVVTCQLRHRKLADAEVDRVFAAAERVKTVARWALAVSGWLAFLLVLLFAHR